MGHNKTSSKVIVRFYGSDLVGDGNGHKEKTDSLEAELISRLNREGLYPKILSTFPGGRIEQFISGRLLTNHEMSDHKVSTIIARKLAAIHSLKNMPGKNSSQPLFTFQRLLDYITDYENVKASIDVSSLSGDDVAIVEYFRQYDFMAECDWLREIFTAIKCYRIVYCHNDIHQKNIMIRADDNSNIIDTQNMTDDQIVIMDYEYSNLNYRWADLSNYFCEIQFFSYHHVKAACLNDYPDVVFRTLMINEYLHEWESKCPEEYDPVVDTTDSLLRETHFGSLVIHLFRVLFFLSYIKRNYDSFQSWKYTKVRFDAYLKMKQEWICSRTM